MREYRLEKDGESVRAKAKEWVRMAAFWAWFVWVGMALLVSIREGEWLQGYRS